MWWRRILLRLHRVVCGNWDTGNTCILTPRISMEDARGCVSLSSSSGLRGGHDGCMSPSGYRVHRGDAMDAREESFKLPSQAAQASTVNALDFSIVRCEGYRVFFPGGPFNIYSLWTQASPSSPDTTILGTFLF